MIEALRATLWRLKIKCHKQTKNGCGKNVFGALLVVLFSLAATRSRAADTITPGQTLFDNRTIVSQGGIFELGFFTPGNSQKYFIGIRYKRIPQRAVVWVANRDKPIYSISNSELKISNDGNLVLTQSQIPIWSSNVTSSVSGSTVAVLLDSGNLVLRSRINSSDVLWQSFVHPTDTWLRSQLFGFDRIIGAYTTFTSWRNRDDPSTGLFCHALDPNGTDQWFAWRNGTKYWGIGLPYLCGGFGSCNAQNVPCCSCLPGFEPGSSDWYLGDFSAGCVRSTPLQCSDRNSSYGENDRFLSISSIQLPVSPWNLPVGTAKDCELACLNNCSCTAYSYNGMCLIWDGPLYDVKQLSGNSSHDALYLRLAASEIPNNEDTRKQRSTTESSD